MPALDPRDTAFLAALTRRGWISPEQAAHYRGSFGGSPGELGRGLVQVGAISLHQFKTVALELSGSHVTPGSHVPGSPLTPGSHVPGPPITPSSQAPQTPGTQAPLGVGPPPGAYPSTHPSDPASGSRPPSSHYPSGSRLGTTASRTIPLESGGGSQLRMGKGRTPTIPGITIEEELGRGGMGAVYRGREDRTGREVAIKVLLDVSERRVQRFEREAQAMQRLRHAYVIELVATGVDESGQPYLAMEFVRGGDLAQLSEKGLTLEKTLDVLAKCTRAIEHAHAQGILHRDLKPANVLLDEDLEPKVTDFGLAKILDRETQLTKTNAILGTPFYMAPEQVRGAGMSELTDVYALGVMLYELLVGHYPCEGENRIELYHTIQEVRPTPPRAKKPEIPLVVSELILWTLEKDPSDRPSTRELGDLLEDLARGRSPRLLPPSLRRPGLRLAIRIASVLLGLVVVVGLGLAGHRQWEQAQAEEAAQDALAELRELSRAARRARGGRDLAELGPELEAHRQLAQKLATLPASVQDEGLELSKASRERRPAALETAIQLHLEANQAEPAAALARELAPLLPEGGDLLLADVLSRHFASAKEAYAAATRVRTRGARPTERRRLAEALLRLDRPAQAANVLEGAAEAAVLKARAWRLAGEPARADQALAEVRGEGGDPVGLAIERALVRGARGEADAALAGLERVRGGNDPRWHEAIGALAAQLERPAQALEAYAQAEKLGAPGGAAARILLDEGYREEALLRLEGAERQADRLDAALARWIGGEPDGPLRAVLQETLDAVERTGGSPRLGASAALWLALLEGASGDPERARPLVTKGRDLAGSNQELAASAGLLEAWLRRADPAAARAALPDLKAAAPARAALELELGLPGELATQQALACRVTQGTGWGAYRALLAARARAAPPSELAERSTALRAAFTLAGARATQDALPRPLGVPRVSRTRPGLRQELVARLVWEARRLRPHFLRPESREDTRARALLLLERALALAPEHVLARIERARYAPEGADGLLELYEAYPYLDEVLRLRITRRVQATPASERHRVLLELEREFQALALVPTATAGDAISCARVALMAKQPERAWAVLAPWLKKPNREREHYRLAVELAQTLSRPADEQERLRKTLNEIEAAYANYAQLYSVANLGEGNGLNAASREALATITKNLPHEARYYEVLSESQFGEGAWALANLTGGRYVLHTRGMSTSGLTVWLYAFGWSREAPQNLIFELSAEEVKKDPLDPAPHFGCALFLGAKAYISRGEDPEDLWRAIRYARLGLELRPDCIGGIGLAFHLTVSARLAGESKGYLGLGRALFPKSQFLTFHEGRAAALRGDWERTLALYRDLSFSSSARRLLAEGPDFEAIRGRKEFADFVAAQQR